MRVRIEVLTPKWAERPINRNSVSTGFKHPVNSTCFYPHLGHIGPVQAARKAIGCRRQSRCRSTSPSAFSPFGVGASSFRSSRYPVVFLLSPLVSPSCLFLQHHFGSVSVFLSVDVHPLPSHHYYIFFSVHMS